ncbi:hypothetical protein HDU93_004540 [Gonapodya sp. JEL0774]|nr:hypothetical protein HDU93_004540 [Gonapodya sp. JEL0774]
MSFRMAELLSLAELEQVRIANILHDDPQGLALESPYLIVELASDNDAAKLIRRSILAKEILALWDHAPTYELLHDSIKSSLKRPVPPSSESATAVECHPKTPHESRTSPYIVSPTTSFRFLSRSFNCARSQQDRVKIVESFSYLDWKGPIVLDDSADITVVVLEEWASKNPVQGELALSVKEERIARRNGGESGDRHVGSSHGHKEENGRESRTLKPPPPAFLHVYVGRLIGSSSRHLTSKFDLKKRGYLGITTMDAELSLIMANLALARPGALMIDPFVGTGSFLLTCSHFGAFTIGSDIDGRQMRGKTLWKSPRLSPAPTDSATPSIVAKKKVVKRNLIMTEELAAVLKGEDARDADFSIHTNAVQYGLTGRILDTVVCDIVQSPWRAELFELYDAIVTDPPYGVRAGAKRIAPSLATTGPTAPVHAESKQLTHYPKTEAYDLADVLDDLVRIGARMLIPGGRLVVWVPEMNESVVGGKEERVGLPPEATDPDVKRDGPSLTTSISGMSAFRSILAKYPQMRLLLESPQDFGKWRRVLVVVVKDETQERRSPSGGPVVLGQKVSFREKFFQ